MKANKPRARTRAAASAAAAGEAGIASAEAPPDAARAVVFEPETFVVGPGRPRGFVLAEYDWGVQRLPRHFDTAAGDGAYLHHVAGTLRPTYPAGHPQAGQRMQTQWLSFRFRSDGVFAHTGAHVAVILRSQSTAAWNRGRGFVFGRQVLLPGDPNACAAGPPGTAHAQPETWWTTSTSTGQLPHSFVWGADLCSAPVIRDGRDYAVRLQVSDGGAIDYRVSDLEQPLVVEASLQDTVNGESALVDGLTGYSLAMVFASARGQAWRMRFDDIASGWL